MQALQFWRTVVADRPGLLDAFIGCLETHGIRYCIIGGQGVNAYVEPLVSLDLDVVVAAEQLEDLERLLGTRFDLQRFPHSLNVSLPGSDLRIQIQTDPRYAPFVARATGREVLGLTLPVADIGDLLQGKIWAVEDDTRRPSKRQKDLADIGRLVEAYPELRDRVPPEILSRLYS
jgi:hypothetical protein